MAVKSVVGATLLAMLALSTSQSAVADETGMAGMHDWRREGGKTCMTDHWHYGSSGGLGSQKAAEVEAIKSWSSFTDFEYGSNWARWSKAASKKMSCSKSGNGWGCSAEARPCK